MKRLIVLPLLLAATAAARAELAEAVLVSGEDTEKVFLTAASAANVEFTTVKGGLNRTRRPRNEIDAIYFFEPPEFKAAIHLYESRDYAAAREAFAKCKEAYKPVNDLPGNYSTLAGFYEMECARGLEDLEGLKELVDKFQADPLTRKTFVNELTLYPLWDAVRTKAWPRLVSLAKSSFEENKEWTGEQLAQIYFCLGQAYEAQGKDTDALNAFNGAFTADYGASDAMARKAAVNCLRIYQNNENVKLAIKLWNTEDEDRESAGYLMLQEAVSLCDFWKTALGGGQPLPEKYATFLKFKAKTQ